jgi:hypothetical protein
MYTYMGGKLCLHAFLISSLNSALGTHCGWVSAENVNLEVLVYFLKAKQGYSVRGIERDKWIDYILVSAGMKFRKKKKFRYGIPAYTLSI